jgi:hypothetical protein
MKLKLLVLIAGTLLAVAYLVGCGGGGNNNNNAQSCQAGYTWNGSSCVYGATGAYGQGNCQAQPSTVWSQQAQACVAICQLNGSVGGIVNGVCTPVNNCGGQTYGQYPYSPGYGYPQQNGGQYGYQGVGNQGCNGFNGGTGGGGYYPGGGGGGYPYPIQYPYNYNPYYGNGGMTWGVSFYGH